MCGIAGILNLGDEQPDPAVLRSMCERIAHRGPDDEGYHLQGPVALGQRRLSVLDVRGGHQPLANEDGSVWVTYNGEIYNFRSLREELRAKGHRFRTESDTEVIVHAYEEYGADCVRRFRGMFAFALWDARSCTLLLARDHFGKKPLFYAEADGQFVFASELQGLLQHPAVLRDIDPTAVDEYLTYGYIPAPRTIFCRVRKLIPGHRLIVRRSGASQPERYWELEYTPKLTISEDEAEERLLELIREAVRLRLAADVPVGALLSGGVDSSLIVGLMCEISDQRVSTFSIGFEEAAFNEMPHARRVAERYSTDHHEILVRPQALEILPTLVRHYGEPYADSSAVATWYVAAAAAEHVTVALNGDGGDECLAGYERYIGSVVADGYARMPAVLRRAAEAAGRLMPDQLPSRNRLRMFKRFVEVADQPMEPRYARWMTFFTPERKRTMYSPGFRAQLGEADGQAWLLGLLDASGGHGLHTVDRLLMTDVQSYLPYDLLVKMDIAAMGNSLETRSPLLDRDVMAFCAQLPVEMKVRGRNLKYLLTKLARRYVPAENLDRRKMGFGVPVGSWLRGELRPLLKDVLLSRTAMERGYFRPAAIRDLVDAHSSGRQDHSFLLWALLCLELWHLEFVDAAPGSRSGSWSHPGLRATC